MSLLDFLFLKQPLLYKFERKVIDEVISRLPMESGDRLLKQLNQMNKVQRHAEGKEVNLYCMRRGKPAFDDSLRFPDEKDESLLASANLASPEKRAKLKAEIWLAKGRLFSLAFNKSPGKFFSGLDLKTVDAEVSDIQIWFDPMHPKRLGSEPLEGAQNLTGWLSVLHQKKPIGALRKPLSESERAAMLKAMDARLPDDYLGAIAQTEGFEIGNCKVLGLLEIRKVTMPEKSYYIIAEIMGQADIAVMQDDTEPDLYRLDYENDTDHPEKLGSSLIEYLSQSVTR